MSETARREPMQRKPILMPPSMIKRVDSIAKKKRVSFAEVVREAVNAFGDKPADEDEAILDALADTMIQTTQDLIVKIDAIEKRLAGCRVGAGPALSMDVYLEKDRKNRTAHTVSFDEIVTDYFQSADRSVPSTLDTGPRMRSFSEIVSTLDDAAAKDEAARCFNCGICVSCDYCRLYCPEMAVMVEKSRRSINMDFCKGCGVCITECPRNAMALEEEIK